MEVSGGGGASMRRGSGRGVDIGDKFDEFRSAMSDEQQKGCMRRRN